MAALCLCLDGSRLWENEASRLDQVPAGKHGSLYLHHLSAGVLTGGVTCPKVKENIRKTLNDIK